MTPATVKFASKLHPHLGKKEENSFHSPFSIQVALGMTAAGAKGATQKCLCSLLESPIDKKEQNSFFKSLVGEVNSEEKRPYELVTANALWGKSGLHFKAEFSETVKDSYGGEFIEVDYVGNPGKAVSNINEWCNKHTHGKIPTIISKEFVGPDTLLVLTNAIYFKGKWSKKFDKKNTTQDEFKSKNTKKVPTMHLTNDFSYAENDFFKALEMDYVGDDLSMLVLLPNYESTEQIDEDIESAYNLAVSSLSKEKVIVSFPKFKIETKYKLGDILKEKLDAGLAFSDSADFSGVATERMKISEVIHKAFVECDEEGTEAAAATAVGMMRCTSVRQPKVPKVFNADHPFVFFIRNKTTGNVLFCGRVTNP